MFQVRRRSSNSHPSEPAAVSPDQLPGKSLDSSDLVLDALISNLQDQLFEGFR